jgi:hypothetical protein
MTARTFLARLEVGVEGEIREEIAATSAHVSVLHMQLLDAHHRTRRRHGALAHRGRPFEERIEIEVGGDELHARQAQVAVQQVREAIAHLDAFHGDEAPDCLGGVRRRARGQEHVGEAEPAPRSPLERRGVERKPGAGQLPVHRLHDGRRERTRLEEDHERRGEGREEDHDPDHHAQEDGSKGHLRTRAPG